MNTSRLLTLFGTVIHTCPAHLRWRYSNRTHAIPPAIRLPPAQCILGTVNREDQNGRVTVCKRSLDCPYRFLFGPLTSWGHAAVVAYLHNPLGKQSMSVERCLVCKNVSDLHGSSFLKPVLKIALMPGLAMPQSSEGECVYQCVVPYWAGTA